MAMNYEKTKFKFSETFNNSNGKSSGSAFVGVLLGLLAGLGFIAGTVAWFLNIPDSMEYFNKVLQLGSLSAILMGVRKFSSQFGGKDNKDQTEPKKIENLNELG